MTVCYIFSLASGKSALISRAVIATVKFVCVLSRGLCWRLCVLCYCAVRTVYLSSIVLWSVWDFHICIPQILVKNKQTIRWIG